MNKADLKLTSEQQSAMKGLVDFVTTSKKPACALVGYAGTGKTTITRKVLKFAREHGLRIMGVAPTHKACKVLENALRGGSFYTIKTITVASLLTKTRRHGYVGSKNFRSAGGFKGNEAQLLVVDEASMLNDKDAIQIINHLEQGGIKAIFIGDPAQLPNPSQAVEKQQIVKTVGRTKQTFWVLNRKDSLIFDLADCFRLKQIMRQADDNPVIAIYDQLRTNIELAGTNGTLIPLTRGSQFNSRGEGYRMTNSHDRFAGWLREAFAKLPSPDKCRMITYTNKSVREYNAIIRDALGLKKQFQVGEWLMGYADVGYPKRIVENSNDYQVTRVEHIEHHVAFSGKKKFPNLVGWKLSIRSPVNKTEGELFFLDIHHEHNQSVLEELIRLANMNNRPRSNKTDYRNYIKLKDQLMFLDDVYQIGKQILPGDLLKEEHPLLTTHISTLIEDADGGKRQIKKNKRVTQIQTRYPGFIEERIDDDKMLGGQETLIDRYQIITKDLDYGYAITVHKSQASTIDHVFIDEQNIDKVVDRWNHRYGMKENKTKERYQLKYVAFTRAAKTVTVLSSAPPPPQTNLMVKKANQTNQGTEGRSERGFERKSGEKSKRK